MNELLQKHGCSNAFSVPDGLKELMSDITREVLREQPQKIFDFIANYLSVLILTREHGVLAVRILDDLCDCRPSISQHLMEIGMEKDVAEMLAKLITEYIEKFEPKEGKEKLNEMHILKKIMTRVDLDETTAARVCQVVRNAYKDYWYREKVMAKGLKTHPEEPWEIAAERTIALYKKTKPSFTELTRAVQKIQAAYRGYYVRRNLLKHLRKKPGPNVDSLGPPADVAASREIDLGPVIDIKVTEDDVAGKFDKQAAVDLGVEYDPAQTIKHIIDDQAFLEAESRKNEPKYAVLAPGISADQPTSRRQSSATILHSEVLTVPEEDTMSHSYHKISFAQLAAPMVVSIVEEPDIIEDVKEIASGDDVDATADVPEDIADNFSEVLSVPSSAPGTADTSDAEENPGETSGEEQ